MPAEQTSPGVTWLFLRSRLIYKYQVCELIRLLLSSLLPPSARRLQPEERRWTVLLSFLRPHMTSDIPVSLNAQPFRIPDPPEELGLDGGKFHRAYDSLADEIDEDMTRSLKEQLDGMLIFVSRISPVTLANSPLTYAAVCTTGGSLRWGKLNISLIHTAPSITQCLR